MLSTIRNTPRRTIHRQRFLAALLLSAVAGASPAGAQSPAQRTFDLAIVNGAVAPGQRVLKVEKGDAVRLRFASDSAGEVHLHGYRLEARLVPGAPGEIAFVSHATGRFPLHWHPDKGRREPGGAHGPRLATLEVRPK